MAQVQCEYCGQKFQDVRMLTSSFCLRHPDGQLKGKHKLYEGGEKSRYTCKYCGQTYSDLRALVASYCMKHPKGQLKGTHSPAL